MLKLQFPPEKSLLVPQWLFHSDKLSITDVNHDLTLPTT